MKPSPSYRNHPDSMNPEALPLWRETLKKFSDDIYESKSLIEQWRAAKAHFERACRRNNMKPYDPLMAMVTKLVVISRSV